MMYCWCFKIILESISIVGSGNVPADYAPIMKMIQGGLTKGSIRKLITSEDVSTIQDFCPCVIAHSTCTTFQRKLDRTIGAYGRTGNGNKTETGNGNWKRKLETEMGTNAPITVQCFLHGLMSSVLSRIVLSNGDMTGFAFP